MSSNFDLSTHCIIDKTEGSFKCVALVLSIAENKAFC